ncbi:MAG TPA: hypothetical protein VLT88_02500 [Desulfosarcina sp.]|nr:hypothetical protein [Desulfosarcina sp.]
MASDLSDYQRELLNRIADALARGGQLTEATLHYIETALFAVEPRRLAAFLLDDADSERDTLLDLIFSPDPAMQLSLEPLLEAARFDAGQAREICDALARRTILAPIHMPDGSRLASIQLPDFVKSRYLDRLAVTWQLDPDLAAAIGSHVAPTRQAALKVRLRNTGRRHAPDQRALLVRYLQRMPDDHPDFGDCLDLVLSILPRSRVRLDAFHLLVEHKRNCFRSLQQAGRFQDLLRRSNMETLMLQGVRAPHASAEELMRRMRLVDLACVHLFGRIEAMQPPVDAPLRRIADPEDAEAVFRSLLG